MPMRDNYPTSSDFSHWDEDVNEAEQRLQEAIAAGGSPPTGSNS